MFMPADLESWVLLFVGILTITTIMLGTVIRLARAHIDRRIDMQLEDTVSIAVSRGLQDVPERVRLIEQKIDNGLAARQERIEKQVDRLVMHFLENDHG